MEIVYSALSDFMRALFGTYVPISYTDTSGINIIPAGLSGVNFEYVGSVFLFALVVFSLFRLLGLFMSNKF